MTHTPCDPTVPLWPTAQELPTDRELERLSEVFKIFSDGSRLRIISALISQELCVADLAEQLGMSQSAVSHQLRLLKAGRLVQPRREGKTVYYSLADDHVRKIIAQGMEHIME